MNDILDPANVRIRVQGQPHFYLTMPDYIKPHPDTGLPTFESLTDMGFVLVSKWEVAPDSPIYRVGGGFKPGSSDRPPEVWLHPRDYAWVMYGDIVPLNIVYEISADLLETEIKMRANQAMKRVDALTDLYQERAEYQVFAWNIGWDGLTDLRILAEGKADAYVIDKRRDYELPVEALSRNV